MKGTGVPKVKDEASREDTTARIFKHGKEEEVVPETVKVVRQNFKQNIIGVRVKVSPEGRNLEAKVQEKHGGFYKNLGSRDVVVNVTLFKKRVLVSRIGTPLSIDPELHPIHH